MMKRLGEGSQQISQIVTLISQIAAKTDLLALNATIEAARAGEQGQGFAVVADEVRKLAERSAAATKEISEIVDSIQMETTRMIGAMDAGTEEVVRGTRLAAEAKQNLQEIIQVSQNMNELVRDISLATQLQAQTAAEISSDIEKTRSETNQTATKATTVTATLEELTTVVADLKSSVGSFRTA
jgi:twitching motility protein PilJ